MPGNLLSIVVGWLATHLVLLGFLGYLLAGLLVAGVIDWPWRAADDESLTVSRTDSPAPRITESVTGSPSSKLPSNEAPVKSPPKSGPALPTQGAKSDGERKLEPPRKVPKLIGGSIPIYEGQRFAPSAGTADAMSSDDPFRPSVVDSGEPPLDGQMTRDGFVQRARRAYWNGDFEAAEAAYMALLSTYPGDADAFGELGNLYQSMGRPAQALDAYYEAGIRLQAEGNSEKLQQIIELLEKEGDSRSDQLRQ